MRSTLDTAVKVRTSERLPPKRKAQRPIRLASLPLNDRFLWGLSRKKQDCWLHTSSTAVADLSDLGIEHQISLLLFSKSR